MLQFPIEFFDDEVRDGFYVPSIMKHNWAAQMEIVNVVDEICKKNNIKYYMFSGTLIGAVRHGGFIPWDDDMDICMLRKDYNRFVKAIMRDKPEKYYVRNCYTDPTYRDVFTRLLNDSNISTNPEFWKNGHGFLCNAGIDVFPLDYIPSDSKKREKISGELMHLCYIIKKYDEKGLDEEIESKISIIEKTFRIKVTRDDTIPQQMYKLMEDILSGISRGESKSVQISLNWAQNDIPGIPIECFKESTRIPLENTTFEAPYLYDKLLSNMFGNYMKTVRVCDIHDFPWYHKLYDEFKEHTNYKEYEYNSELLPEPNRRAKWEQELIDELNENMEVFTKASEMAQKLIDSGDTESSNMLLEKCQSIAANVENIEKKLKGNGRDRVIFFTWKAEYWKYFEPYYMAEVESGAEVLVVPIPFVRLTEVREQSEEYLETEGFPEYVNITDFHDIDYGDVRINRAYIQNPYDDQNGAVILRPFFRSDSLRKYTDELIYVPWFELDEYGLDDERALYMMQYFTRVPGIVAADRIYLRDNQAWLKELYIRDLVMWAGEDTRDIWEDKIQIVSFEDSEDGIPNMSLNEEQQLDSTEGSVPKKILFYYIGTGQILADVEQMIEKLRKNYDVFEESSNKIIVRLFIEHGIIDNLARLEPKGMSDFHEVLDKYRSCSWCELIEATEPVDVNNKEMMNELINGADAFYGDGGVIMHMFSRAKKPVMMQNIMI